ncbi:MAG: LptF/LptG family permease, partial [Selenomonadaceae bacterium]|nr:LptF/LptG family permease [Selenomonadaceae bacterium]
FIYLFVFISVIFFTSKMAGHTEIIAILSSGISFKRFLYPYCRPECNWQAGACCGDQPDLRTQYREQECGRCIRAGHEQHVGS